MDQTKTAIIDAKTAVPFIFFSPKNLKQEEEVIIEKVPKDIIIVCLDIFGCLTQFIRFLLEADEWILNKCYFLILNIPGQPFTLYDPDRLLRIEELSNIYDSILGRLDEDGAISIIRDKFYLLGLGFGALILSNLGRYPFNKKQSISETRLIFFVILSPITGSFSMTTRLKKLL